MNEEKHYGLVKRNPLKWIRFKGWFFLDLPRYIKHSRFINGVELGAKAGRSMYFMLLNNPNLHLVGIDLWKPVDAGAYYKNDKNYQKCENKLKRFGGRFKLLKGDAANLASNFKDSELDFVHYDLQTASLNTVESHKQILSQWIKKVRDKGVIVGRDFRNPEIRLALIELGFNDSEIRPCRIGGKNSLRMEFIQINKN